MNDGYTVDLVCLDFVKAYDYVNHLFLSPESKAYGITHNISN